MDSASFQFVFFGLAVVLVSNMRQGPVWRSSVLMIASVVFLGLLAPSPFSLVPLGGFLLLGYVGLTAMKRGYGSKMAWFLVLTIAVYIWLKKYTFLPGFSFLRFPYFTLGLSYIFFRVLHLLIEFGEGAEMPPIGPFRYLLYTLNFTTFISGPIQRYDDFAESQFASPPIELNTGDAALALERIVRGFFKVNVMAMIFDLMKNDALNELSPLTTPEGRLLAVCKLFAVYPFFLYCNFSGYIDIVIALARLMRLRLPENFQRPFSASSFLDFWSRWHITLSGWFKSYVYNPLLVAMMRRVTSLTMEPFLAVAAFFATFFLVGLWHGQTSEFVVYGFLQGGGVSMNKLWQVLLIRLLGRKGYNKLAKNWVYTAFGRGLTFTYFALTLLWLWAEWKQIFKVFSAISGLQWAVVFVLVWIGATVIFEIWERLRSALLSIRTSGGPLLVNPYALTIYASAMCFIAFIVKVLMNQPAPDIVYKAF